MLCLTAEITWFWLSNFWDIPSISDRDDFQFSIFATISENSSDCPFVALACNFCSSLRSESCNFDFWSSICKPCNALVCSSTSCWDISIAASVFLTTELLLPYFAACVSLCASKSFTSFFAFWISSLVSIIFCCNSDILCFTALISSS